jgi:CRP/FNR family transcriptional regulator, cyclic AMP receptor protein
MPWSNRGARKQLVGFNYQAVGSGNRLFLSYFALLQATQIMRRTNGEQTPQDASNSPLLWGLPEHLSRDLFKRATPVHLSVDQVLFHAGDAGDGCYRVDDGLLKVTMLSPSGSERILALLGSGAVVGELSMIDGRPRSASVVAVRPAALSFLGRAAFKTFAKEHPELYEYLVTLLSARLRETDAAIAAGSFLPNKGRLACTLLELAGDFGQDVGDGRTVIRQKIDQSDLAAMAGIARESANRIINDWQRRKMISRCSGYYCIENKDQLQHEAELSAY